MYKEAICLRCGNYYANLYAHLKETKTTCQANYLNVSNDDMIKNYDKYKKLFDRLMGEKDEFTCDICNKKYKHQSSLCKHKKKCKQQVVKIINNYNSIDNSINNSITNTDHSITNINVNDINNNMVLNLNNFGNESLPSDDVILKIAREEIIDDNGNYTKEGENIIPKYFEALHIDIKENRNLHLTSEKASNINVYQDNEWKTKPKKEIINMLWDKLPDQFNKHAKNISNNKKVEYIKTNRTDVMSNKYYEDSGLKALDQSVIFNKHNIKYNPNKNILQNISASLLTHKDKILKTKKNNLNYDDNSM